MASDTAGHKLRENNTEACRGDHAPTWLRSNMNQGPVLRDSKHPQPSMDGALGIEASGSACETRESEPEDLEVTAESTPPQVEQPRRSSRLCKAPDSLVLQTLSIVCESPRTVDSEEGMV